MVIAMGLLAFSQGGGTVLGDGGTTGTPPSYQLLVAASASDGPLHAAEVLDIRIAAGTHRSAFNAAIVGAIKTWVDSQNGWSIDQKDIYVQPFDNG